MTFKRMASSGLAALPFMEPIHVLGGGSIGLLWASSIRAAFPSYPIALLLRERHRSKLATTTGGKQQATVCLMRQRRPRLVKVPAEFIPESLIVTARSRPIRNLIVATKAFDAEAAVRSVLDRLLQPADSIFGKNVDNHDTIPSTSNDKQVSSRRIILLCNGALAVKEELEQLILQHATQQENQLASSCTELVLATTTHGAYLLPSTPALSESKPSLSSTSHEYVPSDRSCAFVSSTSLIIEDSPTNEGTDDHLYTVVHAGIGSTFLEGSNLQSLARLWHMVGLLSSSQNDTGDYSNVCLSSWDMNVMLWKKLAANCVINPLTALSECTNGELLQALQELQPISSRDLNHVDMIRWTFVQEIVHEVSQVAIGVMEKQFDQQGDPATSDKAMSLVPLQPDALLEFCVQVFRDTAQNQSSMWQDVQHGRPRTEIDYLNGYVVRKSTALGLGVAPANQRLVHAIKELVASKSQCSHE